MDKIKNCDCFTKYLFQVIHFQLFPRMEIPRRKIHCFTAANAHIAKNANAITIYESKTNDGTAKYEYGLNGNLDL